MKTLSWLTEYILHCFLLNISANTFNAGYNTIHTVIQYCTISTVYQLSCDISINITVLQGGACYTHSIYAVYQPTHNNTTRKYMVLSILQKSSDYINIYVNTIHSLLISLGNTRIPLFIKLHFCYYYLIDH